MKKEKSKYNFKCLGVRIAAIVLAVMVVVSYLPVGFAYAAGNKTKSKSTKTTKAKASAVTEDPIREVHKVKVGGKRYCFFVTHNVVMTPKEVAEFGDDDAKLTAEVLKRAGLYIIEANCKDSTHKKITPEDWKKKGGTLTLSQVEIYEEEEEEEQSEPAEIDDKDKSSEDADAGDKGEGSEDSGSEDSGDGSEGTDPSGSGSGDNTEGSGSSGTPSEEASAEESKEDEATPTPAAAKVLGGEMVKVDATEALRKAAPTDGNPSRFYMDLVITDKNTKTLSGEPKKYTTFKKSSPLSPKLIYIAVATEEDAKLGESICEEKKEGSKKNRGGSDPEPKDLSEDDEDELPEFKTISMTDRSGDPLEPTLKEGDPVTLEWKEPGMNTDSNIKSRLTAQPWTLPALIAGVLAIALAAVLIIRRRNKEESED